MLGAVGLPEERDTRDPVEQGAVEQAVLAATLQHPGQPLQLGTSQRGQQVRHAVVVADVGVFVVQHRLAGLGGEVADVGGVLRVVGEHRATTGGGQHLVTVEGQGRQVPVGRGGPAPVHRAQRLGGVAEDAQPELVGHRPEALLVDDVAQQVDGHDRDDVASPVPLFGDGLPSQFHVDVTLGGGVHQHGGGARVEDRVGGGGERHRRGDHHVPRFETQGEARQVQGRGAGGQDDGVLAVAVGGQLRLERVHLRAQRRDPAPREGAGQRLLLQGCHVG